MAENSLSFEQIDIEAKRDLRPDKAVDNDQYTMAETKQWNAEKAKAEEARRKLVEHDITQSLDLISDRQFHTFTISFLDKALKRYQVEKLYPELMAKVKATLVEVAEDFWQYRLQYVTDMLEIKHSLAYSYVRDAIFEVQFFHSNGIDVSQPANVLLDCVTTSMRYLNINWRDRPYEGLIELADIAGQSVSSQKGSPDFEPAKVA